MEFDELYLNRIDKFWNFMYTIWHCNSMFGRTYSANSVYHKILVFKGFMNFIQKEKVIPWSSRDPTCIFVSSDFNFSEIFFSRLWVAI